MFLSPSTYRARNRFQGSSILHGPSIFIYGPEQMSCHTMGGLHRRPPDVSKQIVDCQNPKPVISALDPMLYQMVGGFPKSFPSQKSSFLPAI